ncbi:MAG: CRISPR-associated nuclease/helicase Cas3 [Candidatus Hydrogenedentes bacterium ADurb.Bin179]|nr:MAG: CRISPR-associated nuclease/helicase Cas3 [Candidatus Hydrogenedentes bacterium ADurb.Bin179]
MSYYARCYRLDGEKIQWQLLSDHLHNVSNLASQYARMAKDEAFSVRAGWAGLFHDLGKYTSEFQAMLRGERPHGVEHSGHGAAHAFHQGHYDIALAISGHHAGLADPGNVRQRSKQFKDELPPILEIANRELGEEIRTLQDKIGPCPFMDDPNAFDVHVRMLYSCLVDADRTDAAGLGLEQHTLEASAALLERLLASIGTRSAQVAEGRVKHVREEVLRNCLEAAAWPEQLLSLTAPTGSGKTLASMAFALKRATIVPNRSRRIIVVIPFLSIIEQTAKVYRDALGADLIIEHHCAVDNLEEEAEDNPERYRQATRVPVTENWDAPIVITTSVRFFESLFSNKATDSRRLHNIANSVVILDEVQTLPRHYIHALLSMMKTLADDWGVTFLFCTATQPAFEKGTGVSDRDKRWPENTVREVLQRPDEMMTALRRVNVVWPGKSEKLQPESSLEEVAALIAGEERVLCILNIKRHALTLYEKVKEITGDNREQLIHLSTRMCPRHRLDTLKVINEQLKSPGQNCRVVSTQLVEAGVDLDFPVVLRSIGPLDAIAQAAGRCDREGRLTDKKGEPGGILYLFELAEDNVMPPGAYTDAVQITRMLAPLDIYSPGDMRRFFNTYYDHDLDQRDIQPLRNSVQFREVSKSFTMIDSRTFSILVPYNEDAEGLIRQLELQKCLTRALSRKLQQYQIALYRQEKIRAFNNGAIYELYPDSGIFTCQKRFYNPDTGFHIESDEVMIG